MATLLHAKLAIYFCKNKGILNLFKLPINKNSKIYLLAINKIIEIYLLPINIYRMATLRGFR